MPESPILYASGSPTLSVGTPLTVAITASGMFRLWCAAPAAQSGDSFTITVNTLVLSGDSSQVQLDQIVVSGTAMAGAWIYGPIETDLSASSPDSIDFVIEQTAGTGRKLEYKVLQL